MDLLPSLNLTLRKSIVITIGILVQMRLIGDVLERKVALRCDIVYCLFCRVLTGKPL